MSHGSLISLTWESGGARRGGRRWAGGEWDAGGGAADTWTAAACAAPASVEAALHKVLPWDPLGPATCLCLAPHASQPPTLRTFDSTGSLVMARMRGGSDITLPWASRHRQGAARAQAERGQGDAGMSLS